MCPPTCAGAVLCDTVSPMVLSLRFTEGELAAFHSLPDTLCAGWTVEPAGTLHAEEERDLQLRFRLANFHDPAWRSFAESVHHAASPEELAALADRFDIASASPEQLAELCFVLGVDALTAMIGTLLRSATTDDDLEGLAGLCTIRQMLSDSNAASASTT